MQNFMDKQLQVLTWSTSIIFGIDPLNKSWSGSYQSPGSENQTIIVKELLNPLKVLNLKLRGNVSSYFHR